jgi:hypothetical protein
MACTSASGIQVAPTFGKQAKLGTDPWSFAAPTAEGRPFLLDMATTTVAAGRIRNKANEGLPTPDGWVLDSEGRPSNDPLVAREKGGFLTSLGGSPDGSSGSTAAAPSPTSSRARPGRASVHPQAAVENPGRYRDAAIAGIKSVLGVAPTSRSRRPDRGGEDGHHRRHQRAAGAQGRAHAADGQPRLSPTRCASATRRGRGCSTWRSPCPPCCTNGGRDRRPRRRRRRGDRAARRGRRRRHFAQAREAGIGACAIVLMHAWKYPRTSGAWPNWRARPASPRSPPATPSARCCVWCRAATPPWWTPICRRSCAATSIRSRRTCRHAALFHAVERRPGRGARVPGQGRDPVRPGRRHRRRRAHRRHGRPRPVIGFDMGGTSTDVALYAGGFERAFETEVAGVRMRAPMMAINTVAAGGGSILHFDGARLRVGPDSAGRRSRPGLLPPRRPADRHRRQCLPAKSSRRISRDLRPQRRPAAGRRRGGKNSPPGRGDRARHRRTAVPQQSPRASCASPSPTWPTRSSRSRCRRATTSPASRCNASAAPAASTPAWWPTRWAWRRCSSIPSPACCRPTAWAWPTRR